MKLYRTIYRLEANGRFITKAEYKLLPKHMTIKQRVWRWQTAFRSLP